MKKKILAIDCSKAMRFLLQTVLGNDFQVITAPDGYSAIYWLAKKDYPDMIISDAQLSDMENWELIEQLSTSGLYKNIPLIVLSSLSKEETEQKCEQLGVTTYFTKPFNPIDLLESVKKVSKGEFQTI